MSPQEPPTTVVDAAKRRRYEIRVGDAVAGYALYRDAPGTRVVVHTEIAAAHEGGGLGSRLAAGVLDDIRAHGWTVTPTCPFIAAYIVRHPEYADLVRATGRAS